VYESERFRERIRFIVATREDAVGVLPTLKNPDFDLFQICKIGILVALKGQIFRALVRAGQWFNLASSKSSFGVVIMADYVDKKNLSEWWGPWFGSLATGIIEYLVSCGLDTPMKRSTRRGCSTLNSMRSSFGSQGMNQSTQIGSPKR
jgi:hypothetical protein